MTDFNTTPYTTQPLMLPTVTIAANATDAKLHEASPEVKAEVQQILSYAVAGAEHSEAFRSRRWDGRSSFLSWGSGLFPAGFVLFVAAKLRKKGYKVNVVKRPLPAALGPENPKVDDFAEDARYDYQAETMRRLVQHGRMIAQIATGGGKSRIAKLCYQRIGRPTLFLTTRSVLMYQMAKSYRQLGAEPGLVGDGHWLPKPGGVTCAMVQTITAKLTDPKTDWNPERKIEWERQRQEVRDLLATFELVIGEEAHEVSGSSFFEILKHCRRAHYRLALTATPFMKTDEEANMMLMAAFGSIGIKVSEKQLIDCGILAKPVFKYIQLPAIAKPPKLHRSTEWQAARRLGIVEAEFRNRAVCFEAARAAKFGLSVMILVTVVAHGKLLKDMLKTLGLRAMYIHGEHEQDERQAALNALKSRKIDVLIGSTILDVGVDVPAIGMVILAGGGKAEVALRQRIGRGLREKKDGGPNVALIVDFNDDYNTHLRRHAAQRRAIVEDTPGFVENILSAGTDFNFPALGFAVKEAA